MTGLQNKVKAQPDNWRMTVCDGCNKPKKCARRVDGKWFCWLCATEGQPNG